MNAASPVPGVVRFSCPHCNRRLKAPAANAGDFDKCPACRLYFKIPAGSASSPHLAATARRIGSGLLTFLILVVGVIFMLGLIASNFVPDSIGVPGRYAPSYQYE